MFFDYFTQNFRVIHGFDRQIVEMIYTYLVRTSKESFLFNQWTDSFNRSIYHFNNLSIKTVNRPKILCEIIKKHVDFP